MIKIENGMVNRFPNIGFLTAKLPDDILSQLWKEVNEISADREGRPHSNNYLAGHLKDEFELVESKDVLMPFLIEMANWYNREFPKYVMRQNTSVDPEVNPYAGIKLQSLWVNFQKQHEFNPAHMHSGLFSFAIWLKIPYNLKDEQSLPNAKDSIRGVNSVFNFFYTDSLGSISPYWIDVDKSYEGTIVFFPSSLTHSVNPFYTTTEERISISGNLFISQA